LVIGVGLTFAVVFLIGMAAWVTARRVGAVSVTGSTQLADSDLAHVAGHIASMCESSAVVLTRSARINLNVARGVLQHAGGAHLNSEEKASWNALNQFTKEALPVALPKVLIGPAWLGQVTDFGRNVPLVDEIRKITDGTCTVFQRMNERGDMLRVATSVAGDDGKRAVGTFIPAVNPDGRPNAVLSSILRGESFVGRAFVVNQWYSSAYEPIHDDMGKLIGMLYTGVPEKTAVDPIRQVISKTAVGKAGYIYVMNATGATRGQCHL
jgi:hypothetical protein